MIEIVILLCMDMARGRIWWVSHEYHTCLDQASKLGKNYFAMLGTYAITFHDQFM